MIEFKNLQKVVDQHTVIDIESLHITTSEIAAVVGPVGSGQAVLLDLLIGRSRPTAGEICLAEINPGHKNQFSRQVGVLFAEDTIYKRQSPESNLRFYCRLRGLPGARVDEVLQLVGLVDQAHKRLEKLSSGLMRRLAFGCAILHKPKVLILVDPFVRCDEASITLLRNLILQLSDQGTTILILADDMARLESFCDTIYTLERGRVTDVFKPKEEAQPALPFKIPARLEGSVALVNPVDILYAVAQDGRTYLHTSDGRLPTQFTMTELEARLLRSGFFRAHRGYLVNLQHVKEVIPYTRSSYSLKLDDADGTKIPLSKEAARELRELLGY
jgi:ABC-2 type transport system ATP-binding protein